MKFWDILDAQGRKTGRTVAQGTQLGQNEYHQVVHIWVVDVHGNILIQKRAKHLEWKPDIWAVTSGTVLTNETGIASAVRETREELGLHLSPLEFVKIDKVISENQFIDIFRVTGPREQFLPVILGDRVADAFWTSWRGIMEMINRNEFMRYPYLTPEFSYILPSALIDS